jgi:hypothetical protein
MHQVSDSVHKGIWPKLETTSIRRLERSLDGALPGT